MKDLSLGELRKLRDETLEEIKTLKEEAQPILSLHRTFMQERNHLLGVYTSIKEEIKRR